MLLVVNPDDPSSLQIANAYAALRDIPASNILFIAPPSDYQNNGVPISQAEAMNTYLTPIAAAISARGLSNQIDYIGMIGGATCYSITAQASTPATTANSLNFALSLLTPLTDGSGLTLQNATYSADILGPTSGLCQNPYSIPIGSNPAIAHAASYNVYYPVANETIATQYYMSGTIGYTGTNGNTAAQVISSLQSSVAADGTCPTGAVYFEDNGDVRSTTRDYQWSYTESQLASRSSTLSLSYTYEDNTPGATPQNRNNVLGAVCGAATMAVPNGSTYLGGSWADDLTSYGCDFAISSQTKATTFIAAGASGTTGSVVEPYAIPNLFTNSSIYTFIADGSTFGEAFAKSVESPNVQMPLGDMLSQPYADVPKAAFTSGPGSYGSVLGTISIGASAGLVNPHIATGIGALELLVDGMVSSSGALAGGSGTFNLNTGTLSDGVHEVRIVAINNSQAASEGYAAEEIVVDNHGRSIAFNGGNTTLTSSTATFGLAAAAGDGTVSQIELTCLGRVVAQASGSPGSLSLSPTALAPGDNTIVPVAVYSDGMQVAGGAFVVHVESGAVNSWSNSSGSMLWSNTGNWSGGVLPQNGDGVARFSGSGGTATLDASASVEEIDFASSGSGYTIVASGTSTLTLSSTNGVASQCLINVSGGSHTISAPLALATPGNLVNLTNPADSLILGGGVSGIGGLTKTGPGTLLLNAANTYAGATTVASGLLQIGNALSLQNSTVVLSGGSLALGVFNATLGGLSGGGNLAIGGGTLTVGNNNAGTTIYQGSLSNGALVKTGPGELVLAGSNAYAGGTTVGGGILLAKSPAALPSYASSASLYVAANAVLAVAVGGSGEWTTGNIGALLGNTTAFPAGSFLGFDTTDGNFTYSSGIAGSQGLAKLGAGLLTLAGTNTYTGPTAVGSGTLQAEAASALPGYNSPALVSVAGGAMVAVNVGGSGQWLSADIDALRNNATFASGATLGLDSSGGNFTYSSSIGGGIALAKLGGNTLLLSGSNTYTGPTTIAAGTLQIGNAAALQNSTVVLSGGCLDLNGLSPTLGGLSGSGNLAIAAGTLVVGNNGADTTYSGNLGGGGASAKIGGGALILAGSNAYAGPTTIAAGTLQIGNGGSGEFLASAGVSNSGVLCFDHADALTYSGAIAGGGTLAKAGQGALLLGGAVSATAVNVAGGTLQLSADNQLTANPIVSIASAGALETAGHNQTFGGLIMSGGLVNSGSATLTLTGSLQYQQANYTATINGNLSFSGSMLTIDVTSGAAWDLLINAVISGSAGAGIVKTTNTGLLTLAGANTYTGPTIVNGGQLQIGAGGSGESLASPSISLNNASTLMFDQVDAFTYNGSISGNGSVQEINSGTVVLAGSNTYTGATAIAAGTLRIANAAALSESTIVLSSTGGNLDLNGYSATLGGLSGNGNLALGGGALSVGNNSAATTYSGNLSGLGSLKKIGSGQLTLAGSNTYTGPTAIAAGTLQIGVGGSGESLASPSVSNSGALVFNQSDTFIYAGSISGTGNLVKLGPGTAVLAGTNTFTGSTTIAGGTLQFAGSYAMGGGTSANITLSKNSVAAAGYAINQTFLNRLSSASSGVAALAVSSSNNLNFNAPGLTNVSLGAIGAAAYSGAITPAGTTYSLGGGGGALTVSSSLGGGDGLLVAQPGEVVLTGSNTYTGSTTISGGTLERRLGGGAVLLIGDCPQRRRATRLRQRCGNRRLVDRLAAERVRRGLARGGWRRRRHRHFRECLGRCGNARRNRGAVGDRRRACDVRARAGIAGLVACRGGCGTSLDRGAAPLHAPCR